jgi:hypothetical protein
MPRAAVPRPSNAAFLSGVSEIQSPAGISLEGIHSQFRRSVRIDHNVHVISTHVRRKQSPVFVSANLANRLENNTTLIGVQLKGRLPE